jgi:hypothetical protein
MSKKQHMNARMMVVLWTFIVEQCKRQKPQEWMMQVLHLAFQDIQERNLILRDKATAERVGRRAITAMVKLDNANLHSIAENAERYEAARKRMALAEAELWDLGRQVHNTDNLRTDIDSALGRY